MTESRLTSARTARSRRSPRSTQRLRPRHSEPALRMTETCEVESAKALERHLPHYRIIHSRGDRCDAGAAGTPGDRSNNLDCRCRAGRAQARHGVSRWGIDDGCNQRTRTRHLDEDDSRRTPRIRRRRNRTRQAPLVLRWQPLCYVGSASGISALRKVPALSRSRGCSLKPVERTALRAPFRRATIALARAMFAARADQNARRDPDAVGRVDVCSVTC